MNIFGKCFQEKLSSNYTAFSANNFFWPVNLFKVRSYFAIRKIILRVPAWKGGLEDLETLLLGLTKNCDHFSHKAQQSITIDAEVPYLGLNVYDCMYKFRHVCDEMTRSNCLIFVQYNCYHL